MTKTTVTLPLKVERNSRFVRGKNKARAEIEGLLACHDDMRRLENRVPGLTIGYDEAGDGRGLDDAVWGLIREIASIAEVRNGVIETDLQEPGTGRSWRPSPTRLSVPLLLGGQDLSLIPCCR
jgi:hypothetical protein